MFTLSGLIELGSRDKRAIYLPHAPDVTKMSRAMDDCERIVTSSTSLA